MKPRCLDVWERGFTLLELLIAVTLLGLLMAALFGGLRLGARAWETGEQRLNDSARLQTVQQFVRQRLAQAYPLRVAQPGSRRPKLLFHGRADAVRFATVLPEHLGAGLYFLELTAKAADPAPAPESVQNLVLGWRRFEPADEVIDSKPETYERILIEGIEALDLAYFGAPQRSEPAEWWQEWQDIAALPGLIRVRVRFPAGDARSWPDLFVRPVIDRGLPPRSE